MGCEFKTMVQKAFECGCHFATAVGLICLVLLGVSFDLPCVTVSTSLRQIFMALGATFVVTSFFYGVGWIEAQNADNNYRPKAATLKTAVIIAVGMLISYSLDGSLTMGDIGTISLMLPLVSLPFYFGYKESHKQAVLAKFNDLQVGPPKA